MKAAQEARTADSFEPAQPTPLIDRLKAKRAKLAAEANRRVRQLDRQITLLAQSGAEDLIKEAERALYDD